jgi:MFS family permease
LGSLAIIGPPFGLFLVHGSSPNAVALVGCAAPLFALPMTGLLTEPPARSGVGRHGYRGALSLQSVAPLATFVASTFGYGAVVTSLPLLFPVSAALAILLMGIALTITRTVAGRVADRFGDARVLAPAVGVAALGCVTLWWSGQGVGLGWLLLGTVTFGTGLGALTTLSYGLLTRQATGGSFGLASTVWNLAYDGGIGMGGLALAVTAGLGVPVIYLATAALLTATLPLALYRSRAG